MVYRDNSDAVLSCPPIDPTLPTRDERLLDVARHIVPSWETAESAKVSVVSGGITNLLYLLTAPGLDPVLVRLYGANTETVIDRDRENALFARLSRLGFAPTYHGRFTGGRIEAFLTGFRALQPAEMGDPVLRPLIAATLRQMHDFPIEDPTPTLWHTLSHWMSQAIALTFSGPDADRHAALNLVYYAHRLEALKARFLLTLANNPAAAVAIRPVLAHNDLLSGNILYSARQHTVRFIDYEYGACSYAAFDIANHFCEYAGFDSDFARGFPSRTDRDDFIARYLGGGGDVATFSDAVEFFVLPDHLFWGTWAVIQAYHSPIDFDFMEYARLRLDGFDFHERTLQT